MSRVLLLASKRAYNTDDFVRAAQTLGIELVLGTDRCHVLAEVWPEGALSLDFRDPDAAARAIADAAPLAGIVPTDELTSVIAARAAALLGLETNPIAAARAAGNKLQFRKTLAARGMMQPGFVAVAVGASATGAHAAMAGAGVGYPVVLKPLHLSASRGVMRANDAEDLDACLGRLGALLADPEIAVKDREAAETFLIESFVPGPEVAFEGLLVRGTLHALAIFDKPDPLDGPFFAETIYVTPSLLPGRDQDAIFAAVADAARAIGLRDGPVHAELRMSCKGPIVLELAARSIGGLCNRALRFGTGMSLEELLLCHAAGRDVGVLTERVAEASGVYMLPVPEHGVLRRVDGEDRARAVPGVGDVVITARPGEVVVPLPEGSTYMGFVFATGPDPAQVTNTLRRAAAAIRFHIVPRL